MLLFGAAAFVFASLSLALSDSKSRNLKNGCAKELAGALFEPATCMKDYLARINEDLKQYSAFLFTNQEGSVIQNFQQKYGVTVEVDSSFTPYSFDGCFTFTNDSSIPLLEDMAFAFGNGYLPPYNISSIEVSAVFNSDVANPNFGGLLFYFSTETVYSSDAPRLYGESCDTDGISATFADNGIVLDTDSCALIQSNVVYRPDRGSLMAYVADKNMSTPFYFFAQGSDAYPVYFVSATLKMCTTDNVPPAYWQSAGLTRNIAKANTNIPGFRASDGQYYYSSIYWGPDGQMKYVTITADGRTTSCVGC